MTMQKQLKEWAAENPYDFVREVVAAMNQPAVQANTSSQEVALVIFAASRPAADNPDNLAQAHSFAAGVADLLLTGLVNVSADALRSTAAGEGQDILDHQILAFLAHVAGAAGLTPNYVEGVSQAEA